MINIELIKNNSKANATKALSLYKWNEEQTAILEVIEANGSITENPAKVSLLFGEISNTDYRNTEELFSIVINWDIEFNNGRKLTRKKDISFMAL